MSTETSQAESMKEALKRALNPNNRSEPGIILQLWDLLSGAQEALRESGYSGAVLELRKGLQTDYGQRYTAYLRDEEATFESLLFSVFVDDDQEAFQAEGQIQSGLNTESVIARVREYLLQPHVVEFMRGLLNQFRRKVSSGAAVAANSSDN